MSIQLLEPNLLVGRTSFSGPKSSDAILAQACPRCAFDFASESFVSHSAALQPTVQGTAMDPTASLAELLKDNGLPETVLVELKEDPWKISTLKHFANYFESKAEVNSLFCQQVNTIKDQGDTISNLKQAWREAEATVQRGVKRMSEGMPDEAIDDPLRIEVSNSLRAIWTKTFVAEPPGTWLGPPGMLGRFHREFTKTIHVPWIIRKMKTLDSVSSQVPASKRTRLGENVEISFSQGDNVPEVFVNTCFLYTLALKAVVYTMALAGCYNIAKEGDPPVLFSNPEPLTQHLADAEAYVTKFSGGKAAFPDFAVLSALREIDETIRKEWARLTRAGNSLNEACAMTKGFAGSLWMTKPSRPTGGNGGACDNWGSNSGKHSRGKSGGEKSYGEKQHYQSQPSFGAPNAPSRVNNAERFGSPIKTARHANGRKLCKPFNDARGCHNPKCRDVHGCDAMLPSGEGCGSSSHNRLRHKGPTVPLS